MQKLGFGMMRLPMPDPKEQNRVDEAQVCAMVDRFLERGYTYFDTAYMYHGGESENVVRRTLVERHPRERFLLADKMPLFHFRPEDTEEEQAALFQEQLDKCGVTYFDYYLLHSVTAAGYEIARRLRTFEFLAEQKAQGRIRRLGFSFHDKADVLDRILTEHPEVEFVQLQLNYLDWEDERVQSRKCYETVRRHGKQVVVMEPVKVVPYFGTVEKPECHMLYNVTTMATTWHTVATGDVALLKRQMDIVNTLPKEYVFLNYLRCHDDIGWGLDYDWLKTAKNMEEVPHKKYLNDYLTGKWPGSYARGELYNDDPASGDARLCGTTASLCGLEGALEEGNEEAAARAVRFIKMLHGYMLVQSGIPVIYSGDEIGQLNDNEYHKDPKKAEDSRYLHRGSFSWEKAELRKEEGSYQKEIFDCIRRMENLRAMHPVFLNQAAVWTADTYDAAVLCVNRTFEDEKLTALFNFSGEERTAWINEDGMYVDLMSGERMEGKEVQLPAYGMRWLLRE